MNGVLVGSDRNQEWLLPWWWSHYSKNNVYPVTFFDFGMTRSARSFCEKRGELKCVSDFLNLKGCDPEWEVIYGQEVWSARESWFKKPLALKLTPYQRSLWLDLDCEVMGSLAHLFEMKSEIALAKEISGALYNSGVIAFEKDAPLLAHWINEILERSELYLSDQDALSHLIVKHNYKVEELPSIYNWRMSQGLNIHAVIIHWAGSWGKEFIRKFGGLSMM